MGDEALRKAFAITPAERAAMAAGKDVPGQDNGQNYLYAPDGHTLTQQGDKSRVASLDAPPSGGQGMGGTPARSFDNPESVARPVPQAQRTRPPTPDELMAMAQKMSAEQSAQNTTLNNPLIRERDAAGGIIPLWLTEAGKR